MKRQDQKEQTAQHIAAVAEDLFVQNGYGHTTIRAIAAEANVSVGSVLAHFDDKDSLMFAVLYNRIETILDQVFLEVEQANMDLKHTLVHICLSLYEKYAQQPVLHAEYLRRALFAKGEWGRKFEAQLERTAMRLVPLFSSALERGEIHSTDFHSSILLFFAQYYFVLMQLLKQDFENLEIAKPQITAMISLYWAAIGSGED